MDRAFGFTTLAALAGAAILAAGLGNQAKAAMTYDLSDGAIPLSNLVGTGNSILVGDKIFDNFSYSTTGADMPSSGDVNITPEILTEGATTLWGINISGAFQDTNTPGASDAILRYNVHVMDPVSEMITGAQILGGPDVIGTGKVQVTETWTPTVGNAKIRVYDIEPGGATQLSDNVTFDTPVASLSVTKDILISVANGSTSTAAITSIDQLYTQGPGSGGPNGPEPASLGILALGSIGLLARRRR